MIITPAAQLASVHFFLTMLEVYCCPDMAVKLPFFTRGYELGGGDKTVACYIVFLKDWRHEQSFREYKRGLVLGRGWML